MWRLAGADTAKAAPGPAHTAPWLDPPADAERIRGPEDFLFSWLVNLGALLTKSSGKTKQKLTTFRQRYLPQHPSPQLLFSVYRLLVPKIDKERQVFNLKEAAFAQIIAFAVGADKGTESYSRLVNWRKVRRGMFLENVKEVVTTLTGSAPKKGPSIKEVNDLLDRLARAPKREDKGIVLREAASVMDAMQFTFFCAIVMKDLKVGATEKTIFDSLHADTMMSFNSNCDLRRTLEMVAEVYPDRRIQRQDIIPGQMVRPQLADRVYGLESVQAKIKNKNYVAELKFDGERFQLHKNGDKIHYWSRNMNDFGLRGYGVFDPVVMSQVKRDKCVLDGEMVIWHRELKQFVPFGSVRSVMNYVRFTFGVSSAATDDDEGEGGDEGGGGGGGGPAVRQNAGPVVFTPEEMSEMEVWFMAFDILYDGSQSVIDRPLSERHKLLAAAVGQPAADGHLVITAPGTAHSVRGAIRLVLPKPADELGYSSLVRDPAEVEPMLMKAMAANEEGLVLKDLDKAWEPGNRSDSWLKIKPDYLPTEDIDLLIIGAFKGTGQARGGRISEFLLGIAEQPGQAGQPPTSFRSFCKVGIGMTFDDLDRIRERLKDQLLPGDQPPACYVSTGREKVDHWVRDPLKSLVLTVKADVRTISTTVYACQCSLRFPRVVQIGWTKPCTDILTDVQLDAIAKAGKLRMEGGQGKGLQGGPPGGRGQHLQRGQPPRQKGKDGRKAEKVKQPTIARGGITGIVPGRGMTDLSGVAVKGSVFAEEVVLVLNPGLADIKTAVVSHGGLVAENMASTVTMVVSDVWPVPRGSRLFARAADVESRCVHVLSPAYITTCVAAQALVAPEPKHYMRFCPLARVPGEAEAAAEVDCFGDPYTRDVDPHDVRMLLRDGSAAALAVQAAAQRDSVPAAELTAASRSAKGKLQAAAAAAALVAPHIKPEVDVDAVLSELGLGSTRYNFLRGLRVLLLPLPRGGDATDGLLCDADAAAAAADDVARPMATARLGLCVRLHGGEVAEALDERVTHIVCLPHSGWAHPPVPGGDVADASLEEVLAALLQAGGPDQEAGLRSRLEGEGRGTPTAVVTKAWLLGRLADAQRHVESQTPGVE